MIVRMWEGRLTKGTVEPFRDLLAKALPSVRALDGCEAIDVYGSTSQADGERVVVISRWRDVDALATAAGTDWQTSPVVLPGEQEWWGRPPHVWHFEVWDV